MPVVVVLLGVLSLLTLVILILGALTTAGVGKLATDRPRGRRLGIGMMLMGAGALCEIERALFRPSTYLGPILTVLGLILLITGAVLARQARRRPQP